MQKYILILILIISISSSAQNFNYPIKNIEPVELVVTYSLKFQQDSLNSAFIRQEDMLLFLGENVSKFMSENFFVFDTILRKLSSRSELQKLLLKPNSPITSSAFTYRIFKNYPNGKLTYIERIIDGTFRYEEDLGIFNWQLTDDTTTINNYKSQKAICNFGGRKWIAWFCADLPYNEGPYKFNGLPGLILKVYDTKNHYIFEMVSINAPKDKLMIDLKEKEFIKATKQDLFRTKEAFREDIINRAKAAGLSLEKQKNAARNMATRNNPIELKRD